MFSEIRAEREHGTIWTKVQNNSASDLCASEQLANQISWQIDHSISIHFMWLVTSWCQKMNERQHSGM